MTKPLTWTIKFETTFGTVVTVKYVGRTMGEAIDAAVECHQVANVLAVHQGRVRWL